MTEKTAAPEWTFTDAKTLIDEALQLDYFHPHADDQQVPIPSLWVSGVGNLIVIVGENASGKSFMRRIVTQMCRERKIECIPISMEGRGGSYGGLRGMIYGDETWESTGVNSAGTVVGGLRTCRQRETPHVIFWDEPDLGLSENGAAGMGQAIANYCQEPNPHTLAAIVVTHSKPLVQQLVRPLNGLQPHYLHLGTAPEQAPKSFQEWLDRPVVPRSPEDIREGGHQRFKLIGRILKSV